MKVKYLILAVAISLSISCTAFADRRLDRDEILQIFQKLTSNPMKTWLSTGTIEATHEEYRAPKTTNQNEINNRINEAIQEYQSNPNKRELTEELQEMKLEAIPFNVRYRLSNECTMNSTVVVKFDGDRFYWEINVNSRTDSVRPGPDLAGNFMTKQFNLDWNTKRIFVWDGGKYTAYFLPANQAIVDSTGRTPHVVKGPLTAGLIPWGYDHYTYQNLSSSKFSAIEKDVDGKTQIHLTLNNPDGSEMLCAMDPDQGYAVTSYSTKGRDITISAQYGNHRLVSGNWVPTTISIEQYDAWTNRLLARDIWNFTNVNGNAPMPGSFDVEYKADTLIKYSSHITKKPIMYRYSHMIDTDLLLAERLTFAASEGTQPQNCATAALKYATSQLGKDVSDKQLAQLVSKSDRTTSLYKLKRFAQDLGFYCRAVKTDIQTLKSLSDNEIILHIPKKNHFVVLGDIDNEYVWNIDLASDKFCYRTDINLLGMDWTEGTALLISSSPITSKFIDISDNELRAIIGGSGYTCTNLLQEYDVVYCDEFGGMCGGDYEKYYTRYGCEAAESGSCSSSRMIRCKESPCIEDPYYPWHCDITGEWTSYYMRACDQLSG